MGAGKKINEEELAFDDDMAFHNGTPFTGIAVVMYPSGRLKCESPYKDGFEEGLCREWYESGQLKREWMAIHGRAEGKICEWHPNGRAKSIVTTELGVTLRRDEWNDNGELVELWRLDPASAHFKALQAMKKAKRA